jgi:hypothetical protein
MFWHVEHFLRVEWIVIFYIYAVCDTAPTDVLLQKPLTVMFNNIKYRITIPVFWDVYYVIAANVSEEHAASILSYPEYTAGSSETLVGIYKTTRRFIPERRNLDTAVRTFSHIKYCIWSCW